MSDGPNFDERFIDACVVKAQARLAAARTATSPAEKWSEIVSASQWIARASERAVAGDWR